MTEQKAKIIKGRIILALHQELGRRPTPTEIERYFQVAKVLYSALVPTPFMQQTPHKQPVRNMQAG